VIDIGKERAPRPRADAAAPPREIAYDRSRGLDAAEAEASRARFGTNALSKKKKAGFLRQFIGNFNDPIIRILLGALAVNVAVTFGHVNWYESFGIAAAVLIATLVSTISEYGSEAAFETLCGRMDAVPVAVLRDGALTQIPLPDIAVGDVVRLSPGDIVPADGILAAGEVWLDESPLSGESEEKRKEPDAALSRLRGFFTPDAVAWTTDAPHQLLRGSRVCGGEGEMLVGRVGDETFLGGVAAGMQKSARPSPLKERLTVLSRSVSRLGYAAAALIAAAHLTAAIFGGSGMDLSIVRARLTDWRFLLPELTQAATVAISILVVAVPEGLPMMITVVLSSNMKRMLAGGVLVRRLVGIETAGNMNILFTDKTGTLTTGRLRVAAVVGGGGTYAGAAALHRAPALETALRENHRLCRAPGRGNATDRALDRFFGRELTGAPILGRTPFDTRLRWTAGWTERDGAISTEIRGAPEAILPRAAFWLDGEGRTRRMTPAARARFVSAWEELAASAHRVLAAARTEGEPDGNEWTLLALIGIRDQLRPEAREAVRTAREAGIQTVMITGDHPLTAAAIARECGILSSQGPERVVCGAELSAMTDAEVTALLPQLAVVARALPSDKSRLVRLSQEAGLVVGMTGDGINDAPALRAADVGFAMGSGTDAAREAASIVITDDRFSSITRAVLYGRTIFLSIRKFITFQLTMNLCAVGVSLLGPFFGAQTPVTVIQMLWINIIMDTLGALAFAGEPPLRETMTSPPLGRAERILSPSMTAQILFSGGFSLSLCLWFLRSPAMHRLFSRGDEVYYLTVFFALFVFCGIANAFLARTERLNLTAHLSRNRPFLIIMAGVAAVQLMIVYFGGEVFRCEPLTLRELTIAALLALSVIPAELARRLARRARARRART